MGSPIEAALDAYYTQAQPVHPLRQGGLDDAVRLACEAYSKDLVEALEGVLNEIPPCHCDPAYKDYPRDDPQCTYHSIIGAFVIEPARTILATAHGQGE